MFVWKPISGIAWRQLNNVLIKHKKICTNIGLNDCNIDDYEIIKSKYVKVDIHFKESERNSVADSRGGEGGARPPPPGSASQKKNG